MNREVTEYEIKLDTFQMGANKVVGRDGSPANFFQKYWTIVGGSVFRLGKIPNGMNSSIICLIPKH